MKRNELIKRINEGSPVSASIEFGGKRIYVNLKTDDLLWILARYPELDNFKASVVGEGTDKDTTGFIVWLD